MKIAFIWQGFSGRYGMWRDGLYAAMRLIKQEHEVRFFDFPLNGLEKFNPDVVLYWEAPVTSRGKDAENWFKVLSLPYKRALLFAGGPLKAIDVYLFDLVFIESEINAEECEREGIPYKRAFGVNTQIMYPDQQPIIYDAFLQATFADWKRHTLFAQAMREQGAVAGRVQEFDRNGYNECVNRRVRILGEQNPFEVAKSINSSYCVLNTSNEQGGGQRCTLEAMACGVPIICMSDSPKNAEFVRASGGGIVAEPDIGAIRVTVEEMKKPNIYGKNGFEYVQKYWTEKHYANAIVEGIQSIS